MAQVLREELPRCVRGHDRPIEGLVNRWRHGDTTGASAQIRALRGLGIQAEFRTNGRIKQLIAQMRLGLPIPAGWIRHSPISAPAGDGHHILVVGWDPASQAVLMHDLNGEADLVGGGSGDVVVVGVGGGVKPRS